MGLTGERSLARSPWCNFLLLEDGLVGSLLSGSRPAPEVLMADSRSIPLPPNFRRFEGVPGPRPSSSVSSVPSPSSSSSSKSCSSRSSIAAKPARRTRSALFFKSELCMGDAFPRLDGEGATAVGGAGSVLVELAGGLEGLASLSVIRVLVGVVGTTFLELAVGFP